jgi:hypothetical protein
VKTHAATRPPLTPEQRAARIALIGAALDQKGARDGAAFDTYRRICPSTDHRCSEAHYAAHRTLIREFADSNAAYQSVMDGMS